jgi:hypothetical protein
MGVDELRKKVLDCERKGKEKEWLIGILMGKEVALKVTDGETGVGVLPEGLVKEENVELIGVKNRVDIVISHEPETGRKESSVSVTGTKRASSRVSEGEDMTKRAKTTA